MGGKKAVIDVGTNSIKLLVAEERLGRVEAVVDRIRVTRLGEGLRETGEISPAALDRTAGAIAEMCDEARGLGADDVAIVGTEALRRASNAASLAREVERSCGATIRVIDGDEEAELSFGASIGALGDDAAADVVCFFDIGGGSSETVARSRGETRRASVPVGALTLHDRHFAAFGRGEPVSPFAAGAALREAAISVAASGIARPASSVAAGAGGTVTTLCCVMLGTEMRDAASIDGRRITAAELDRQIALYISLCADDRAAIPGLRPDRADIILPGALILRAMLEHFRAGAVAVSARGLRYGIAERMFGLA